MAGSCPRGWDSKASAVERIPYATIEGLVRRGGDLDAAIEFVMRCLRSQLENSQRPNVLTIRYEELVRDPDGCTDKIGAFVPELGALNHKQEFLIKGKTEAILNKDIVQIQNLTKRQITRINEKLDPELMSKWGFEYVTPGRFHNLRRVAQRAEDWLRVNRHEVATKLGVS